MSSLPNPPTDVPKPRTWGTHCCGCCCDMRTAVIVVNLVSMGLAALSGSALLTFRHATSTLTFDDDALYDGIDDEAALQEMEEFFEEMQGASLNMMIPILATVFAVRIVASSLGVYGAMKYKIWPVVASLVGYGLEIIYSICTVNLIGLVMSTFFAYPHFFFVQELKTQKGEDDASKYKIHVEIAPKDSPSAIV